MADIAAKLDEARALIEPEGAWTQGKYARGKSGREAKATSKSAVCFCAMGAVGRVFDDSHPNLCTPGMPHLAKAAGTDCIYQWNDAPERTQAEVIEALRKAAELARQEQSA